MHEAAHSKDLFEIIYHTYIYKSNIWAIENRDRIYSTKECVDNIAETIYEGLVKHGKVCKKLKFTTLLKGSYRTPATLKVLVL